LSRLKTTYNCQQCGFQTLKWLGKCPECGAWSSLVEEVELGETRWKIEKEFKGEPTRFSDVIQTEEDRLNIGIEEFDRVLGGGLVRGSVILIGGDPGIGKSTLLLASSARLTRHGKVLYVSGEESLAQIKLRGKRLGIQSEDLYLLAETSLEEVFQVFKKISPIAVILDSVQTLYSAEL